MYVDPQDVQAMLYATCAVAKEKITNSSDCVLGGVVAQAIADLPCETFRAQPHVSASEATLRQGT